MTRSRTLGRVSLLAVLSAPFAGIADGSTAARTLARAEARWAASCPLPPTDGLCARQVVRTGDLCPEPTTRRERLEAVPRRPALAREAMGLFAQLADRADAPPEVRAQARLRLAEVRLEALLALDLPPDLNFDRADVDGHRASVATFSSWLTQFGRAIQDTTRAFDPLAAETPPGPWTFAARARIGQVWAVSARLLESVAIPRGLARKNQWGANERSMFCDAMADKAEPLLTKAREELRGCVRAPVDEAPPDLRAPCQRALEGLGPE